MKYKDLSILDYNYIMSLIEAYNVTSDPTDELGLMLYIVKYYFNIDDTDDLTAEEFKEYVDKLEFLHEKVKPKLTEVKSHYKIGDKMFFFEHEISKWKANQFIDFLNITKGMKTNDEYMAKLPEILTTFLDCTGLSRDERIELIGENLNVVDGVSLLFFCNVQLKQLPISTRGYSAMMVLAMIVKMRMKKWILRKWTKLITRKSTRHSMPNGHGL